jgi:hypothetical protein
MTSFFHTQCIKLPTKIEKHQLCYTLSRAPSSNGHLLIRVACSFCDICSRHLHGFIYKCDLAWCGGILDVQFQKPLNPKVMTSTHFFIALDANRKCNTFSMDNKDYVFVCTNCDCITSVLVCNILS